MPGGSGDGAGARVVGVLGSRYVGGPSRPGTGTSRRWCSGCSADGLPSWFRVGATRVRGSGCGWTMSAADAALYEEPFRWVKEQVQPCPVGVVVFDGANRPSAQPRRARTTARVLYPHVEPGAEYPLQAVGPANASTVPSSATCLERRSLRSSTPRTGPPGAVSATPSSSPCSTTPVPASPRLPVCRSPMCCWSAQPLCSCTGRDERSVSFPSGRVPQRSSGRGSPPSTSTQTPRVSQSSQQALVAFRRRAPTARRLPEGRSVSSRTRDATDLAPHDTPHDRNASTPVWSRHHCHRPLARPRGHGHQPTTTSKPTSP